MIDVRQDKAEKRYALHKLTKFATKNLDCGYVNGLQVDSRKILPGNAFVAIKGLRNNGLNYIELSGGSFGQKTQIIKLGKADYTKGFIIDFRVENETADGISVVDGSEKDGIADRNYIFQVEKFLGKWMLKSNIIQTVNKSDLDKSTDYTDYTSKWQFNNQYISLQSKDTEFSFQKSKHKRTYDDKGTKDIYNSDQETFIAGHTFHLKDSLDLTTGFEHNLQEIDFDTNIAGYDSNVDKERHNHGYYINLDKQLDSGVFVHGGVRLDTPNTFVTLTNARKNAGDPVSGSLSQYLPKRHGTNSRIVRIWDDTEDKFFFNELERKDALIMRFGLKINPQVHNIRVVVRLLVTLKHGGSFGLECPATILGPSGAGVSYDPEFITTFFVGDLEGYKSTDTFAQVQASADGPCTIEDFDILTIKV